MVCAADDGGEDPRLVSGGATAALALELNGKELDVKVTAVAGSGDLVVPQPHPDEALHREDRVRAVGGRRTEERNDKVDAVIFEVIEPGAALTGRRRTGVTGDAAVEVIHRRARRGHGVRTIDPDFAGTDVARWEVPKIAVLHVVVQAGAVRSVLKVDHAPVTGRSVRAAASGVGLVEEDPVHDARAGVGGVVGRVGRGQRVVVVQRVLIRGLLARIAGVVLSVDLEGLEIDPFLDVIVSDAQDRKSTRLNSSHTVISYAVFCLKKKKKQKKYRRKYKE